MAEVGQPMRRGRHHHCGEGAAGESMQPGAVKRAWRQTATACTLPADAALATNAREKRVAYQSSS
ncbi:hypothetical protein C0Z20_10745 [Trinickia symbiotica]|uniref:Uncharacterized protein n=1 Tax=Trinickia symbiotica TaxID=863227 RepID=A0A2N7X4A8_9BURK|nr:hypothetical protein C0Z20_10745 [Trinickia symbiotica]